MIHTDTPSGGTGERAPDPEPDPDVLLELHRELWAAQRRQAATAPGTHDRLDADAAVSWFEWLLVDYLQRAALGAPNAPGARRPPNVRPAA
jgi:hypothetical protein